MTQVTTPAPGGPAGSGPDAAIELSARLFDAVTSAVRGKDDVVRLSLVALLAGGHLLVEDLPGTGKTLLAKSLAAALGGRFGRVQCTPDLLPSDITGTSVYSAADASWTFRPGPLFANVVLADEINRATPKTQAALLEAMQEKTVTVANRVHPLAQPFFVLATQNPLEMEGTYPLPEAQLDRFFFKLIVPFPSAGDLSEIVRRTTARLVLAADKVADGPTIQTMGGLARQIPIASHVVDYVVRLVLATHPEDPSAVAAVRRYVRYGVSPRGAQAIVLGAKIRALIEGRLNVSFDDVRAVAPPALRHRLILNFEAEASETSAETIVAALLQDVPETA